MPTKYWISTSSGSFNTAANWSDTLAPANNDTLIFGSYGTASVDANLSTILTGVTIIVEKSYPGNIGTISGGTFTYLTLDGGTAHIGQLTGGPGTQPGSSQIMLNFGTTAATVTVYDSGSSGAFNNTYPAILLDGTVLTLRQFGGSVGIATDTANTSTLVDGRIAPGGAALVPPTLYLGRGVTTTFLSVGSGRALSRSANTNSEVRVSGGGYYSHIGTGAHSLVTAYSAGFVEYSGTGTITALTLLGGTFDRRSGPAPLTITDLEIHAGSSLLLDNGIASSTTITNPVNFSSCAIQDVIITLPDNDSALS
jgi:hypothetical protein